MPFKTIRKFDEFDAFHLAANGRARTAHPHVHVFRLADLGPDVVSQMPLFRISFYLLGVIRNADFKMTIYDTPYDLQKRCAVIIFKPGQIIQFSSDPAWEGYVVMFKEDFLTLRQDGPHAKREFSLLDPTTESFAFIQEKDYEELSQVFEKLLDEYRANIDRSLPVIELYLHILFYKTQCLVDGSFEQKPYTSRKASITYDFKKLLQQNLRSSKRVADFADMLNISPKYLTEVITEVTGQSPKELINHQVIVETKTLLRYSDHPLGEIALAYNFKSPSHFSQFFKEQTGSSPLDFRRSLAKPSFS